MTPEAAAFVAQADLCLQRAATMLAVGLNEDAGRTAYLCCFNIAQALIFERTGRTMKTHRGVPIEFFRLTKESPGVDPTLRRFLSQAYEFKTVADYSIGDAAVISSAQAADAIESAKRFKSLFCDLLTSYR